MFDLNCTPDSQLGSTSMPACRGYKSKSLKVMHNPGLYSACYNVHVSITKCSIASAAERPDAPFSSHQTACVRLPVSNNDPPPPCHHACHYVSVYTVCAYIKCNILIFLNNDNYIFYSIYSIFHSTTIRPPDVSYFYFLNYPAQQKIAVLTAVFFAMTLKKV